MGKKSGFDWSDIEAGASLPPVEDITNFQSI
jgi:hypothetical protein